MELNYEVSMFAEMLTILACCPRDNKKLTQVMNFSLGQVGLASNIKLIMHVLTK